MHAQLLIEQEGYFGRATEPSMQLEVNEMVEDESLSSETESTVSSEATLEEER